MSDSKKCWCCYRPLTEEDRCYPHVMTSETGEKESVIICSKCEDDWNEDFSDEDARNAAIWATLDIK